MNRAPRAPWSLKKKILLLIAVLMFIGLIVLIIIFVVPLLLFGYIFGHAGSEYEKVVKHSQQSVSSIVMPAEFIKDSVQKVGDPIDIALSEAGYDYTYYYKNNEQVAKDDLVKALQNAGYVISTDGTTDEHTIKATNDSKNSSFLIVFTSNGFMKLQSREIRV